METNRRILEITIKSMKSIKNNFKIRENLLWGKRAIKNNN